MGKRSAADKRAIEQSVQLEQKAKVVERPKTEVGTDVDQELWSFFSGAYAADVGLRSSAGGQLDRLAYRLGPSTSHNMDGWNKAVRFGVVGPSGRLELGKVGRALVAVREREPGQFEALKGYYTVRPHGAFEGLLAFGKGRPAEYVGVVLVLPETRALTRAWRMAHIDVEKGENRKARETSAEEAKERLGVLEGRLRVVLASNDRAKHLRAGHLRKQIEAAKSAPTHPDTEKAIKTKWTAPTVEHATEVLRELARRAAGGAQDAVSREEARRIQTRLIDAAERLWRAARDTYQVEREKVDDGLRSKHKRGKKDDSADRLRARLMAGPEIPAETD